MLLQVPPPSLPQHTQDPQQMRGGRGQVPPFRGKGACSPTSAWSPREAALLIPNSEVRRVSIPNALPGKDSHPLGPRKGLCRRPTWPVPGWVSCTCPNPVRFLLPGNHTDTHTSGKMAYCACAVHCGVAGHSLPRDNRRACDLNQKERRGGYRGKRNMWYGACALGKRVCNALGAERGDFSGRERFLMP